VDYITSPGYGEGEDWRRKVGLPRGGPATVITTLGILRFEPDSKEMVLVAIHPGVSVDKVIENTGWPLKIDKYLSTTPAPTRSELNILTRFDPDGFWTGA
jgi:glutaconate CoA-transferase subunit B